MNCPHCNKPGVSTWSKAMAGTALAAKCRICGKPSSISGRILWVVGALFHFIFIGASIASFYYWNWLPLIAALVVYVLFHIFLVKYAPLKAIVVGDRRNTFDRTGCL